MCWGRMAFGQDRIDEEEGPFAAVTTGTRHTCVTRREDGHVLCAGERDDVTTPLPGAFDALVAGDEYTCGLRANGRIECWGRPNDDGRLTPPGGAYMALRAGRRHACALTLTGVVRCWGDTPADPPPADDEAGFTAVAPGTDHACALTRTGLAHCWGDDAEGQRSPP